jgi:hypothetical protein
MKMEAVRISEMSSVQLISARCPGAGNNTVVTLPLVFISCCVIDVFTQFSFGCKQSSKKGKDIPVTGRGGPQGCERSKLPHYLDKRPHLTPRFLYILRFLVLISLRR